MQYTTLSNGVRMPMLGYGVFQIPNRETEECVSAAIAAGYRLIDTAQSYGNEEGVGAAVAKGGVAREELFLVSKVWVSNYAYEDCRASIDESLARLGADYLDLMLLHQCYYDVYGAWRALEEAYEAGKLRAIGVSNFDSKQLMDLCAFARIKPMLNQVETHVFWQERPEHEVMERLGVQHMAWGPFAEGANGFFANPLLASIGRKYGKGVGQVALRFLMDEGVVVNPKSSKPARMAENIDVFDFELIGLRYLSCTICVLVIHAAMANVVIRFFAPAIVLGEGVCALLSSYLLAPVIRLCTREEGDMAEFAARAQR